MANSLLSINDLPQILDIPHHPMGLTFPKCSFGEKKSCLAIVSGLIALHGLSLTWVKGKDLSFYHIFVKGCKERKMKSRKILSLSAHFIKSLKMTSIQLLRYQLSIFCTEFLNFYSTVQIPPTILDIIKYTCTLTASQKQLLSEVSTVMKLIASDDAKNATSERTFSALRRITKHNEPGEIRSPNGVTRSQSSH